MPDTPLSEIIAELRRLEAKATNGPFEADGYHTDTDAWEVGVEDGDGVSLRPIMREVRKDDALFVAALLNHATRLLDAAERADKLMVSNDEVALRNITGLSADDMVAFYKDRMVEHRTNCIAHRKRAEQLAERVDAL